jgi:hypothetical protein
MTSRSRLAGAVVLAAMVACFCVPATGAAQQLASKSAPLAKELAALLDQKKLDSIAAKDPSVPDYYVGALYFPGLQLLVVSSKYAVAMYINEKLAKKDYREVYIDLNSASVQGTKTFIEDLKADGLLPDRSGDDPFDIVEMGGKRTMLDGDYKKQQLSEQAYADAFKAADEAYAKYLALLIAEAKKN